MIVIQIHLTFSATIKVLQALHPLFLFYQAHIYMEIIPTDKMKRTMVNSRNRWWFLKFTQKIIHSLDDVSFLIFMPSIFTTGLIEASASTMQRIWQRTVESKILLQVLQNRIKWDLHSKNPSKWCYSQEIHVESCSSSRCE